MDIIDEPPLQRITITKDFKDGLEKRIKFMRAELETIYNKASLLEDMCFAIESDLLTIDSGE